MVPFVKKRSQASRRPLSVKLIVTLVGAVCLSLAFLMIAPTHAAPASQQIKQFAAAKSTRFLCTNGDLKVCIRADRNNDLVVSKVTVTKSTSEPAEVPTCPVSVNIKLFDNSGQITDTQVGQGCGTFNGPTTAIQAGDTFAAQVVACFSAAAGDCAAVPSPDLNIS